jgi:hypothetical protein
MPESIFGWIIREQPSLDRRANFSKGLWYFDVGVHLASDFPPMESARCIYRLFTAAAL